MARACRYRCGECRYRTPWLGESAAADRRWLHYARRHPDVDPRGQVEYRNGRSREGIGCLVLVGIMLALLIVAASCHHRTSSTSEPDSTTTRAGYVAAMASGAEPR